MSISNNELINRFADIQQTIWDAVKTALAGTGIEISFSSPLVVPTRTAELSSEFASNAIVIRPTGQDGPLNLQALVVPTGTAALLVGSPAAANPEEIRDSARPIFQIMFDGFAAAFNALTGHQASLQIADPVLVPFDFSLFDQTDEVVRTQVSISTNDGPGIINWLVAESALNAIFGISHSQAQPEDAKHQAPHSGEPELDILLDIPLEISVELGRTSLLVQDVLDLGAGSVIELERAAGEPVDVLVNGRLVARGEVVVIEDNFGIRITEIINPHDRVTNLGEAA